MKPFSEDSRCVKCGAMQAGVKWCDEKHSFVVGMDVPLQPIVYEYLLRTCRKCGFSWRQACLDAKEAPDAHN